MRGRDRERLAVARLGVIVREVVDQFLDADRILRRRLTVVQEAADVGVRGGVDVGGEGRQRGCRVSTGCRDPS